jgi:predicted PurR-regulated permease PerM
MSRVSRPPAWNLRIFGLDDPEATSSHNPNAPPPRRVIVEIPIRQTLRTVAAGAAAVLGLLLLWRSQEVLFLLLAALLLATAIEPIVRRLRRGPLTPGFGVLVVYTAIVLVIGVPGYIAVPALIDQGNSFLQELPGRLEALREYTQQTHGPVQQAAQSALDQGATAAANPAATQGNQLLQAGLAAAHTIFDIIMVFVLAFYWIVERPRLKRALVSAVPRHQAREVNDVWVEIEEKLGGWVRGQLLLMAVIGVLSGVGYWVLGLPNPLLLAVLAGLFEIIPIIGPILSSAPAFLVALATDPIKAALLVVYALVIQQLENNVLLPRIMGHTVGISPLAVLVGILVGAAVAGIPGAFLAVPVAGGLQVALSHAMRVEDPQRASAPPEREMEPAPRA